MILKQQLETEQESLAEADEAVKVAEEKLAANDVSITSLFMIIVRQICLLF